ncbi:MAG: hypothetical protein HFI75_09685 [Lachnospiraceae bacterium]|nr:hypothetical protein [Lachnospiraceae bacterium]
MKTLYFEHENKKKRTNLIIVIIALVVLTCIGFGYTHVMKQTGADTISHTTGSH